MVHKWKIWVGLATLILLGTGVYFASNIYAQHSCGGHDGGPGASASGEPSVSGGHDHGGGGQSSQPADKAVKEDPNTPEALLKKADKLLKDVDKTKDVASLMKHCNQMLNKAGEIMTECTQVTEGHGWFDSQSVETATKLMKKCVEMSNKSQSLIPKDQKKHKDEEEAVYTCPMHPEVTMDKPGRCPKCGMNLKKTK